MVPRPPAVLEESARAKWIELTDRIDFAPHELDALTAYCVAWGRFVSAETWLRHPDHDTIMTITDDKGQVKSHGIVPQVALSERSAREMTRLSKVLRLNRKKKAGV